MNQILFKLKSLQTLDKMFLGVAEKSATIKGELDAKKQKKIDKAQGENTDWFELYNVLT